VAPGNILAKKKAGSVCVDLKDKYYLQSETNTSILKDPPALERNQSKGRTVLTEPVQRHSVDVKITKITQSKGLVDRALNREKAKTQIQIPTIKKNY